MTAEVLIVDADPMEQQRLSALVQEQGHKAAVVRSSEEAIWRLAQTPSPLILADLGAPQMTGLTLLRHVQSRHPRLHVVLVCEPASLSVALQAMQGRTEDVLTKPLEAARLEELLTRVLGDSGEREAGPSLAGIVTEDPRMLDLLATAARLARSPAPVLIYGESGTGKELFAREVHLRSERRDNPFVALNCASVPESLLESELFGHERGAFTGAVARRLGKFQMAHQGTLLLDEVSETTPQFQAKLLRTLQEGQLDPVGRDRPVRVDVRIIATTNRCLRDELQIGRFRQDLFFRLNVLSLQLPPLRERPGDIPRLARHFVRKHGLAFRSPVRDISEAALRRLAGYGWPGNVRELENCIQRALLLCQERVLQPAHIHLDYALVPPAPDTGTRSEMERRLILSTLERLGGNRTRTAEVLGISVRTVRNRLRQYRQEAGFQAASPAV